MAQSAEAVKARLAELGGNLLQFVGKEIADLPEMLYDDETIHAVGSGEVDNHSWLLIVTERRILLTYHGSLGGRQDIELPLSQVKSVSCKTGMMFGELLIDTGGQTKKLTKVQKVHARKVAEEVSRLLHAPKPVTPPPTSTPAGDDSLARLERLAALHEKGALTDDEFAAQKQAMLSPTASEAVSEPAVAPDSASALEVSDAPESKIKLEKSGMSKKVDGTTACPKCKNIFPAKIPACPKCGHELTGEERAAGIKKNNKNMMGCLSLLAIAAVVYFAWPQSKTPPAPVAQQTQQSVPTVAYTVLPYSHPATEDTTARADRKRARVLLTLNSDAAPITSENLAATCMAAAQYYAQQTGAQALGVFIYDQPGENWGHTQVASCNYAPDNGGFSGQQGWTWADVQAADRTTTAQEKEIARLWNTMRGDFQKDGSTNEKALSAAIAKKLGISPDDVTLGTIFPAKVDFAPFVDVKVTGPTIEAVPVSVSPPAPVSALTKQQVRDEVKALLKELDGFKSTSMFKQCIYGCGDKNPATAWNARREALQGQLTQQKDLPAMLKAAPGYLWMLGMAYGKNEAKDIKTYRSMVEEGLTD